MEVSYAPETAFYNKNGVIILLIICTIMKFKIELQPLYFRGLCVLTYRVLI